jgi:hypothetical protein
LIGLCSGTIGRIEGRVKNSKYNFSFSTITLARRSSEDIGDWLLDFIKCFWDTYINNLLKASLGPASESSRGIAITAQKVLRSIDFWDVKKWQRSRKWKRLWRNHIFISYILNKSKGKSLRNHWNSRPEWCSCYIVHKFSPDPPGSGDQWCHDCFEPFHNYLVFLHLEFF